MKLSSLVFFIATAITTSMVATPAQADLRPPPLVKPPEPAPVEARVWLAASVTAMKGKDMALAASLCDPRGYHDNLAGGRGNPLESLFSQGAKKGWHLTADFEQSRRLRGNRGVILRTTVRDNESSKALDEVWVLLIKTTDAEGATRWLALGASESQEEIDALAARFLSGGTLAPPKAE